MSNPDFNNVRLLINADGSYQDLSTYAHAVSKVGTAAIASGVVKYGDGSLAAPALGDRFITADLPEVALGASPFCLECWLYLTGNESYGRVFQGGPFWLNANSWALIPRDLDVGGVLAFSCYNAVGAGVPNGRLLKATAPVPYGVWSHLAVTRDVDGVLRLFLNGVLEDVNLAHPTLLIDSGISNFIGLFAPVTPNGADRITGYVDEARLVIGEPVYTTAFTPPDKLPTAATDHYVASPGEPEGSALPVRVVVQRADTYETLGETSLIGPTGAWQVTFAYSGAVYVIGEFADAREAIHGPLLPLAL